MDPMDMDIKIKKGPNGQTIAYCDDCPGVTGEGPNEKAAMNNFWKSFNKSEQNADSAARAKKHAAAAAAPAAPTAGNQGGKKKAA